MVMSFRGVLILGATENTSNIFIMIGLQFVSNQTCIVYANFHWETKLETQTTK